MKINLKDPYHIKALVVSAAYSFLVVILRPLLWRKKSKQKIVVFYGHTLNGNLKVFYDYLTTQDSFKPYFLALDTDYYHRLISNEGSASNILSALKFSDMVRISRADVFVTSHGLHLFTIIRALSSIKFIDVWHAVSYKGFSPNNFRHLYSHDEIWVSSQAMKDLYLERYGFNFEKVKVTGYGRTDQLINGSLNKSEIIEKYSIPKAKKYILLAPTWQQDLSGRSVLPFEVEENIFFRDLDKIADKYSAHLIFRTHLNSTDVVNVSHLKNVSFMPYSKYEVVEEFLYIADILVTDWSSIGIDYLPLERPAIFLDVPAPFRNGFNMGPEHRYGDIVSSFEELKFTLEENLKKPQNFLSRHKKDMDRSILVAYGSSLDGKSTERYFKNLKRLLK